MTQSEPLEIRRTIRRHQLREMVPLADSTIYEMEQRGEFPWCRGVVSDTPGWAKIIPTRLFISSLSICKVAPFWSQTSDSPALQCVNFGGCRSSACIYEEVGRRMIFFEA